MGPTPDQILLIQAYEPALYFAGVSTTPDNPGPPGPERFFPSDAKRYLEHAALYLATAPFATRADWGNGVVAAGQLGAVDGDAQVFIGEKDIGASPQYPFLQTKAGQEHFLDVSGWKANDTRADLDKMASLYASDQGLNDSQFQYHAEFFDAARLRRLFNNAVDPGGSAIDFNTLFDPLPGKPPVLNDPALICYYLFYPGHEESLPGCVFYDGPPVATALDFGSFAGEWSCIALLLDRPSSAASYAPKWVGLTNRNLGNTSVNGQEVRSTMRLLPWSSMQLYASTHPRFFVGLGSHGLYLPNETLPPLSFDDPSAAFCGGASALQPYLPPEFSDPPNVGDGFSLLVVKVLAGAASGGGPFGGILGAAAGLVWGIAELESGSNPLLGSYIPLAPPQYYPAPDTVSSNGVVVYPKGLLPGDADPNLAMAWRSFSTVDRATQVLWGDDPDGQGYTGRWGADVAQDPQNHRSGMAFPKFWQLFFETLVRNNPPSRIIVLTRDAGTTWVVPSDWNNTNNSISLIAGGGGGSGGFVGGVGGAGGGGGEFSSSSNMTLTPGTAIPITIGAGGVGGANGTDGTAGKNTTFNTTVIIAAGGGGGQAGVAADGGGKGGIGGGAGGVGTVTLTGGAGGAAIPVTNGAAGGGGAGGPGGLGRAGGTATSPNGAGGGGGGAGGGSATAGVSGGSGASTAGGDGGTGPSGAPGGAGGTTDGISGQAGSNGSGGGGGANGLSGGTGSGIPGNGGSGTEFDGVHGAGGGGGGASIGIGIVGHNGGNGGLYGGGGGGATDNAGTGGNGADGIIVINYVP
jgi:hypothetical protein